jgi:3-deoxy-7-phosphoheptulonate synthase
MLIHLKPTATKRERDDVREWVEGRGLRTRSFAVGDLYVVACSGPDTHGDLDFGELGRRRCVARIEPSVHPLAARGDGDRRAVLIGDDLAVGGRDLLVAAGPCSVESRDQLARAAWCVAGAGARLLRGGAYKPRSSPYAFQGLGLDGLRLLADVRQETGLPVVTEVMDPRLVETVAEHADVLQVGARSMQNVALLRELGRIERPVLLKRGLSATLEELLLAAEYVLAGGNAAVILCERGIRTFGDATRFTLDLSAVPALQRRTHLPVLVDPSHAAGNRELVEPLACAAVAAGADGLIVEVHPRPAEAWSDADQALTPEAFAGLMRRLAGFAVAAGRKLPLPEIAPHREVVG